jgi:hypothetical protein
MSHPAMIGFLWGLTSLLLAGLVARQVFYLIAARIVLANTLPAFRTPTDPEPTALLRGLLLPGLAFAAVLLSLTWLLGYAFPQARTAPAYGYGVLLGLLGIALASARRFLRRPRPASPAFPHAAHPDALQAALDAALEGAVVEGTLPPGLHGEMVVFLQTTSTGAVTLSLRDDPTVPDAVRDIAGSVFTRVTQAPAAASSSLFILRY